MSRDVKRFDVVGFVLVVALVVMSEGLAQWMVQRPWMAQLLAPGGDLGTILLVGLALTLRLFVVVALPALLVGRFVWAGLQSSRSRR